MADSEQAPRTLPVVLLITLLAGAALALQGLVLGDLDVLPHGSSWLLLTAGFVVAEVCVVHLTVRHEAISFAFAEVPWVLGLFLVPSAQLISARVLGGLLALAWHRRQNALKLAFNVAQCWLGAATAVAVWRLALGAASESSMRAWLAAVASAIVIELVGALAITAVLSLRGGPSGPRPVALGTGTAAAAANACFALVAYDIVKTDWRGLWAVAVLAVFLFLAQRAHVTLLRRHDSMERLQSFTRRVGSTDLSLDAVAHEVLLGVRELMEVETVELSLAGADAGWLADGTGVAVVPVADVLPAISVDDQRSRGRRAQSLTVRLPGEGGPMGSLTVSGRLGDVGGLRFSDLRLLEAVAGHAAVGLHNARLADQLRHQAATNEHQAMHDALTGLPNRLLFDRLATAALTTAPRSAVLLLDLDRFKEVNDTLGHAAGDAVLRVVGERLHHLLDGAGGAAAGVARLGGDEFALILSDADELAACACALRIAEVLSAPLDVAGVTLTVGCSIGVALAGTGDDVAALLRRADVAMYQAKSSTEAFAVYSPERDHHSAERLSMVADLRHGIASGELVLAYQPKVSTADGQVRSVEALVRWDSPTRGRVSPQDFIDVAEQTGLIEPLTNWVLTTALAQCRRWLQEGLDLSVAVNLSPRTLHDPEFVGRLAALLAEANVPANRLILEITEGAVMSDPERAIDVLWQLRRAGVRLSVDDMGVGQSSLAYLKRLPVHEVKIDRSFVTSMVDDADDEAIVMAVVQLVHRLGMTVVAEGVEDERTWKRLAEHGADAAQGYWMSRPVAAAEIAPWLAEWAQRVAVVPQTRTAP